MKKLPLPITLSQKLKLEMFRRQILSFSHLKLKDKAIDLFKLAIAQSNYIILQHQMIKKLEMENGCLKSMVDELNKIKQDIS